MNILTVTNHLRDCIHKTICSMRCDFLFYITILDQLSAPPVWQNKNDTK